VAADLHAIRDDIGVVDAKLSALDHEVSEPRRCFEHLIVQLVTRLEEYIEAGSLVTYVSLHPLTVDESAYLSRLILVSSLFETSRRFDIGVITVFSIRRRSLGIGGGVCPERIG
jgi:hypothetical protein